MQVLAETIYRDFDCPTHGMQQETVGMLMGRVVTQFGCPVCNREKRTAEAAEKQRKDEAERQVKLERRMHAAGIPLAFRGRSFDGYQTESQPMEDALRVVRGFADDFWIEHINSGTFLVLGGERGTGKSHLAIAAAMQVMARGTAMYARAGDLIRRVRSTWRKDSPESEDEVLRLLSAGIDLLVIDEVGVQRGTDDEQIILFDILDRRYADLRPTILLTNLEGKEFAEVLGPRIMDRLRERAVFVPFKWQSYRGR